jgi:signal transduction histidine kinase
MGCALTDRPGPARVPALTRSQDPARASSRDSDAVGQLIARQESLQAALEIAQALVAGREPATMWRQIARRARRLLGADTAIVRTVGEDGLNLVLRGLDPRRSAAHQAGLLVREEPVAAGISGAVHQSGRPRVVKNIGDLYAAAAEVIGTASHNGGGATPQGPALIVPLGPKGHAVGTLIAVNQPGGRSFGRRDVDLVRSFAAQAALAVQQAEFRRARQSQVVLEERERLARELHDDVIQGLRDITGSLTSAADRVEDPALREGVASLVRTVEDVVQDLWNHVYGLHPSVLAGRSVEEALYELVRDFEKQSGMTTVAEFETAAAQRLRGKAGEVVQILREAFSNVWRHANAQHCWVSLGLRGDTAWLLVQDDGVGFDPRRIQSNGYGLLSFKERVDRLGGQLEIESRANAGTALRITIPLRPQP